MASPPIMDFSCEQHHSPMLGRQTMPHSFTSRSVTKSYCFHFPSLNSAWLPITSKIKASSSVSPVVTHPSSTISNIFSAMPHCRFYTPPTPPSQAPNLSLPHPPMLLWLGKSPLHTSCSIHHQRKKPLEANIIWGPFD